MQPLRRRFLRLAAGAAALPAVPRSARAQDYPARPVRLLVGFAAGGPTDVFARLLADLLSARWGGRPVIVENRPGAGTILATAAVAKAPPDGYTLMVAAGGSFMINPALGQKLPYDPLRRLHPGRYDPAVRRPCWWPIRRLRPTPSRSWWRPPERRRSRSTSPRPDRAAPPTSSARC